MQGETLRNQTNVSNVSLESSRTFDNQPLPDGPCVNTVDRAFYLLSALDNFTKASSENGYETITKVNEKGNKFKIRNLQKKSEKHLHDGRAAFLYANNLDPYAKNSIKKEQLIAKTVVMSDEFKDTYTGPGTDDKRRILRKQLFKQIELLNSLE